MMRLILALVLTTMTVHCMGDDGRSFQQIVQIVRTCIDAQIRIDNPLFDPSTGVPSDPRVNSVVFRDIPNASVYIVELAVTPPYPDAPIAMCYFDHGDKLTRALFQTLARVPRQNDVVFRVQSMFENASEEQANAYLLQTRYTTVRLSDVLDEKGLD